MSKKPTILDIAKQAGVSPATVSRVINDFAYVSDDKRERVLEVMKALGYRPNLSARHMRTQRSRLIGFLTDEVATTPYAGDLIKGAEEAAWQNDYILLVISTGKNADRARLAIDAMLERAVEGIVYAAMFHQPTRLPEIIREVPAVLANCYLPDKSLPSFVPDEIGGGYRATMHLIEGGHQRIGFINVESVDPGIPASIGRLEGYLNALKDAGIDYDPALVVEGHGHADTGYPACMELMNQADPPTALFCGTDRLAMGVYDALRDLELRIPNDVAVVGFDNQIEIASALRPALTTIQLPHYEMGRQALEYLIFSVQSVTHELPSQQIKVECPLVLRKST